MSTSDLDSKRQNLLTVFMVMACVASWCSYSDAGKAGPVTRMYDLTGILIGVGGTIAVLLFWPKNK